MTDTADRDAAPAAAEGADVLEALAILKEQHPFAQCDGCPSRSPHVICLGHGYHADWPCDEALVIGLAEQGLSARPAPSAAPREDGRWKACDEAWRRVSASPYLTADEAARAMFDAGAEWAAAREAARGEG